MEHIPRNSLYHPANIINPNWYKTRKGMTNIAVVLAVTGYTIAAVKWRNNYFYQFDNSNKGKKYNKGNGSKFIVSNKNKMV
uniref:Uncharacterized protein n=1 Tax=Tetranychus urticae TaxID=32264 RepID=T1KEC6_TETUR